jgi:Putative F0F1-ATPase subunit Ca2+/Mg2+ transporter
MSSNKPDKNPNKWLVLISLPIQMGIVIFAFSWLGGWLDERYPNENGIYKKVITLLGVFLSLYYVIKQVQNLDKKK